MSEEKHPGLAKGELYYNDSDVDFNIFILDCIEKYREKSDREPTLALVHESDWKSFDATVPIYATINIFPGHVLVGRLIEVAK